MAERIKDDLFESVWERTSVSRINNTWSAIEQRIDPIRGRSSALNFAGNLGHSYYGG